MKCKIVFVLMSLGGSLVWAQNTPQNPAAELSDQDKKRVAQIATLQKQIDSLESAITARQKAIETTTQLTSDSVRASIPYLLPKPAIVLNVNGSTFIVNSGRKGDGLRKDDKLLIIRYT